MGPPTRILRGPENESERPYNLVEQGVPYTLGYHVLEEGQEEDYYFGGRK